jgi:hippurate hydrolase
MANNWSEVITQATVLRRQLHQQPELSWEEEHTALVVRQRLDHLGIRWRPCARTGTVAWLGGAHASIRSSDTLSPHIALRGDMDALPIQEQTGVAWQSRQDGCMHACGHDGHSATLLATAHWLKLNETALPAPVTLVFQPAEEGGHGAKAMIDDGALEGVDAIFGWHNWPAIPFGHLACPNGIVMCGNGTFQIRVSGRGGHASQPELCRDPVLAASALVMALQQIVSRRLAPQQAAVVSVTSIEAVSAPTVIAQNAVISGSIRVPDSATRLQVNSLIDDICQHTAAGYGVAAEVDHQPRYEATINHPEQARQMRQGWEQLFGAQALEHGVRLPIMASEDFSYYLNEIPGAFALVGSDDGSAPAWPCHSPHYDFNDRLIEQVTRLYARLVHAPQP